MCVRKVSSSCCIPLSGANRLAEKKEKKKKKKKKKKIFLEIFCCREKKTDVFSQTVQQQIAVPERELIWEWTEQKIARVIEGNHEQSQGSQAQGGVVLYDS